VIAMKFLRGPWVVLMLAVDSLLLGVLLSALIHPWHAQMPTAHPIELPAMIGNALVDSGQTAGSASDRYASLIGQPIFQQDRKYTPPPKVDNTVVLTPPPDFVVTGFLGIPGRPGKAFLRERTGSRTMTVAVGDNVDGWTVASVAARQVNLRQGERSVDLVRGGPPIAAVLTGTPNSVVAEPVTNAVTPTSGKSAAPVSEIRQPVQPAPPASTTIAPGEMLPPVATPPTQPQAQSAGASVAAAKPQPAKAVTAVATLQGVFVTPQPLPPAPRDFGPPMLVSPRGPLLTYKPPSIPDGK